MSDLLAAPSSRRKSLVWMFQLVFLALLFVPGFIYSDDKYWLSLFSRFMALALFALSVDLVWGYTGMLSLGQGLYFGLGAYAIGYSLKLRAAARAADLPFTPAPDMAMPDFMEYCRLDKVPDWIAPLIDLRLALLLAVLLPVIVATLFGLLAFKRRIKGVYFSLITQALVLAVFTLVTNQQPYTGGVVGMNTLDKLELFGVKFVGTKLYFLIAAFLALGYLACLALVRSKFGKVLTAIRDNEYRVLALGYNTAMYKTFILAFAGALAGIAGGLYVSVLGTTGPDSLGINFSIEVVIFVAVGGRGTLIGAIIGAVAVNYANTKLNNNKQFSWDLIRLTLFVGASILASKGLLRLFDRMFKIEKKKHWIPVGLCIIAGVLLATLFLWAADQYIIRPTDESWPLILGGLFIGIVVFLPDGIVGGVRGLGEVATHYWQAWRAVPAATAAAIAASAATAPAPIVSTNETYSPSPTPELGVQSLTSEPRGA